jgi:Ca2+-binding RTX toxin-like protein
VTSGTVAITSPTATSNPVVVTPTSGTVTVGVATPGAQAVVNAQAGTTVNITTANLNGNPQNLAGSVIQATDGSRGSFVVDYEGAVIGGTKVNGNTNLADRGGVGTIAGNAPPGTFNGTPNFNGTPDTYIQTGAGNDSIQGSEGIDFIRAGAGNYVINAGAGNDIVRPGSGNDLITLGKGNDVVYLTVDQLQGIQTKTISDFSTSGADKIQIASNLKNLVSITGQGSKQIVITLSGAQSGTTTIVSNGQVIKGDDIQFV